MKASTAALKYLLAGAFNISWGDDPEADASTDKPVGGKAPKPAKMDTDTMLDNIKSASTLDELVTLKPAIRNNPLKALTTAYLAREKELKNG
jgi:hypothetical protein